MILSVFSGLYTLNFADKDGVGGDVVGCEYLEYDLLALALEEREVAAGSRKTYDCAYRTLHGLLATCSSYTTPIDSYLTSIDHAQYGFSLEVVGTLSARDGIFHR